MNTATTRQDGMTHTLQMERRKHVIITGVQDVCSFHETEIVLRVDGALMVITGEMLHIGRLFLEDGRLDIDGQVDSIVYEKAGAGIRRRWAFRRRSE